MTLRGDIIKLVTKEPARRIFTQIENLTQEEGKVAYYNEILRSTNINPVTFNKYISLLLKYNILQSSLSQIEMAEQYESKNVRGSINRTRSVLVKIFRIAPTDEAEIFRDLLRDYTLEV